VFDAVSVACLAASAEKTVAETIVIAATTRTPKRVMGTFNAETRHFIVTVLR
jgi:hypothetical protein